MLYQGLFRRCGWRIACARLTLFLSPILILLTTFNTYQFNQFTTTLAAVPPPCFKVSASGSVWQNLAALRVEESV
jgi:hypothetical protein